MKRHPKYKSRLERERRNRVTKQKRHEHRLCHRSFAKTRRRTAKSLDEAEIFELTEGENEFRETISTDEA